MRRIALPWGSVVLEADSPRLYELIVESREESLRRRCYLRLDFDPGEWTVTVRPHESVVCSSCGREMAGVSYGDRRLCGRCARGRLGVVNRPSRGSTIVACGEARSESDRIVKLAAWGRHPRQD